MNKNTYFEATCIDMTHDGKGIVTVNDFPYYVNNMLLGETGKLKVIKVLKNFGIARMVEVLSSSPHRIDAKCPIFKQCGGCHLQHLDTKGQQLFKTKRVEEIFRTQELSDIHVYDCLMMEDPWFYRNKVQMPLGFQKNTVVTGFYKQRTNDIIPCDTCYIQNEASNDIINDIKELFNTFRIEPYNKETKTGNIRHILTKYGHQTKEIMLVFITNEMIIPNIETIIAQLVNKHPMIKTVLQNVNQRTDNVILGEEVNVLYGPGYIKDILLGNTFKISLHSFYQINPIQTEVLYSTAISYADLSKDDVVIDAYCGIGTISLSVAKHVKKVYGVEIVPQAIVDAKENARCNSITNTEFYCVDAGEYMVDFARQNKHIDVVFVDPPRKGCSTTFLDALVELSPPKIIYISCDVTTQARDVAYLQEGGYKAVICQPVDMFPQSHHIESVVLLQKIDNIG